jgi:hypothetical protein
MSAPRFASINGGILARKGEAQPWSDPNKKPLVWDTEEALRLIDGSPEPHHNAPHPEPDFDYAGLHTSISDSKKCTVRVSHHDYERLGILAVKQGKTRQRLLQEAVDKMLEGIRHSRQAGGCACLSEERCAQRY